MAARTTPNGSQASFLMRAIPPAPPTSCGAWSGTSNGSARSASGRRGRARGFRGVPGDPALRARRPRGPGDGAGRGSGRSRARRRRGPDGGGGEDRRGDRRSLRRGHGRPPPARRSARLRGRWLRRLPHDLPPEAALSTPHSEAVPHLRLRVASDPLLALPWELPLEHWCADQAVLRDLPVGPSRHLVRFVVIDETTYALKEESVDNARHEYEVLVRLEALALPSVRAIGIAEHTAEDTAILVTEYLRHSLQYRRLLMRVPLTAGGYRDRLLD